jgi:DNA-binding response OmpR family regulator
MIRSAMERPVKEDMLTKASKRFLAAISCIAAGEANTLPPDDKEDEPALRVLIVDDHRATTDTLFSLAVRWGHDVRRAYDGVWGLELARSCRPEVMLVEMLMPDVDGFEVARQVRGHNGLEHCFIIAVTGRTDAKHRAKSYEAGVDLLLIKPVHPSDMRTLLSLESGRIRQLKHSTTADLNIREVAAT